MEINRTEFIELLKTLKPPHIDIGHINALDYDLQIFRVKDIVKKKKLFIDKVLVNFINENPDIVKVVDNCYITNKHGARIKLKDHLPDISEKAQLQNALRRARENLQWFTSDIGHNQQLEAIGSPFNNITSYTDYAEQLRNEISSLENKLKELSLEPTGETTIAPTATPLPSPPPSSLPQSSPLPSSLPPLPHGGARDPGNLFLITGGSKRRKSKKYRKKSKKHHKKSKKHRKRKSRNKRR